jgi:N,N'-diacetylchitobiose transport system substrate-binding protein
VRYTKLVALGMSAVLVLSACGDDDDSDEGSATSGEGEEGASEESGTIRLWLNGPDTPDELVDFAIAEFNEIHPNVTVEFERQQWDGIVERLTTALSSDETPDVVELGNTQAQAFEAAGALLDLTDNREALGGDDLLQSLVESGTYDGRFYGVPYLAGARIVVYRTDLLEAAGLEVPTTMQEFIDAGIALKQANASVPNFSGIYFPGRNWHAALTFIWETGGDIAVQDGDEWDGMLSDDSSLEGLELVQQIMTEANGAPADSDDANDFIAFCNGEVGMLMGPGWKVGQILTPETGCPEMEPNIGVFALPSFDAGETAPVFLGGSNIAVSANSQNPDLAQDLIEIMIGEEYQTRFLETGVLPGRTSLLDLVGGTPASEAQAEAATNSRFVPSSENWAAVEAANVLPDMLVAIAQGGDVAAEAERADAAVESLLNQ